MPYSEAEDREVHPAGSAIPEVAPEGGSQDTSNTSNESGAEAGAQDTPKADSKSGEKLLAGKYKSVEDLEQGHKNLEQVFGSQSQQLGEMKQAMSGLQQNVAQLTQVAQQQQNAAQQAGQPDYEKELAQVTFNVQAQIREAQEDGRSEDIGAIVADGMTKTNLIASKLTAMNVNRQLQQHETQRERQNREAQATKLYQNFVKENRDFEQLKQTGALKQVADENPVHDDFSAFYFIKAQQAGKSVEEAKAEAYKKGQAEIGALKDGAKVADRVLSQAGSEIQKPGSKKGARSAAEQEKSMMATLQKLRANSS